MKEHGIEAIDLVVVNLYPFAATIAAPGCTFEARCPFATARCREEFPPLEEKRPGHIAACWHSDRVAAAAS